MSSTPSGEAPRVSGGHGSTRAPTASARFRNQRVAPLPIEPGGALAVPDADGRGLTLWTACQVPFRVRETVAALLGTWTIADDTRRSDTEAAGARCRFLETLPHL